MASAPGVFGLTRLKLLSQSLGLIKIPGQVIFTSLIQSLSLILRVDEPSFFTLPKKNFNVIECKAKKFVPN